MSLGSRDVSENPNEEISFTPVEIGILAGFFDLLF